MKFSAPFVLLFIAVGLAEASISHAAGVSRAGHARHARHNRLEDVPVARRDPQKSGRCKQRAQTSAAASPSVALAAPVKVAAPSSSPSSAPAKSSNNNSGNANKASSGATTPAPVTGLIRVANTPQCGKSGATKNITPTTGPNGSIDFLNCGVDGNGWTPPDVRVTDIVTEDLNHAVTQPGSPFKACSQDIINHINQYAGQNGLPPILVASIIMQESSCNPNTVGGAGEQGLMQITKDKCGAAPGGNCQDINYNIATGTKFFADTLNANGGNLLKTIGMYNGWATDMTIASATAAAHTGCCRCQNNVDYLQQTLNGWVLNINPYTNNPRIGKYFNLDQCN